MFVKDEKKRRVFILFIWFVFVVIVIYVVFFDKRYFYIVVEDVFRFIIYFKMVMNLG